MEERIQKPISARVGKRRNSLCKTAMEIIISQNPAEASAKAAEAVKMQIAAKRSSVVGLATGGTVLGLYENLVKMCADGEISFKKISTFNLDEYVGIPASDPNSYRSFMEDNLFSKIDIDRSNTHIPDGCAENVRAYCVQYENKIRLCGGIDLQLLGIGSDGHIGFNEPSSSLGSRTRVKTLTEKTRRRQLQIFRRRHLESPNARRDNGNRDDTRLARDTAAGLRQKARRRPSQQLG